MAEVSIRKNFAYSTLLTGANYIFPLIVYPYVSRVLGVSNIGTCNFVSSIVQYFILFSMLGVDTVGIREIARCRGDRDKLSKCFSSIFTLNTILTVLAVVLYVICIFAIPQLHQYSKLMWIGVVQLVFNYMLIDWLYKGLEEFKYVTVRTVIVRSLYVISIFLFVKESNDYNVYFFLTCLTVAVNALINCFHARKYLRFSFRNINIRYYLPSILMLGLYTFLTSMYTTFNTTYLGFVAGDTEVGYYTTATKLFSFALAAYTALTGVMLPRMSSLLAQNKEIEFKSLIAKTTDILISFSIPIIIFLIVFAPDVIRLIAGEGYEGAIKPMRIVMPLIFIIGYEQVLVTQTLMPLKKDKVVLINSFIGASVGVIANLILVPKFSSIGSSLVWIISEFMVLVASQFYASRKISLYFPVRKMLFSLVSYAPLVVFLILCYSFESFIIRLISGCFVTIVSFFIINSFFGHKSIGDILFNKRSL